MQCPSCGKQIRDGAAFCGSCGAQIGAGAQAPAPPQQYAPPPQHPPQPGYGAEPPRKSGSTCWITGCVALAVLLLLGSVGGYFAWKYAREKAQQTISDITDDLNDTDEDTGGESDGGEIVIDEGTGGGATAGGQSGGGEVVIDEGTGGGATSGGTQSGATIPSPMQTLDGFLVAAGGDDGYKMLPFMNQEAKAEFQYPEIWGQGDFTHVSWDVTGQTRISDTHMRFEVKQTCADMVDHGYFYDTWTVGMKWSGSEWQVSEFDMTSR